MTHPSDTPLPWSAATIERLNARFDVEPDDDIGVDDWPEAMAMPSLVGPALEAYDRPDASPDERAVIVELLFNTFEFCGLDLESDVDWRRTLDRLERDHDEHATAIRRWAEPDDGNPWLISADLQRLVARRQARG